MSARGAYYNDNDAFAGAWLRRLIAAEHLPGGDVDDRSIVDVQPDDLRGYTAVHLFAGIGGWPYALDLAGWPADRPVWSASCPCPPFSVAGRPRVCPACSSTALVWHPGRTGVACCAACLHEWVEDDRHLWPEALRLIAECRPPVVFGEQVAGLGGLDWFAGVRGSLEVGGYVTGAFCAPAASVGAPHRRERLFWVADATDTRRSEGQDAGASVGDARSGAWCGELERSRGTGRLADAERDRASRAGHESSTVLGVEAGERAGQTDIEPRPDGSSRELADAPIGQGQSGLAREGPSDDPRAVDDPAPARRRVFSAGERARRGAQPGGPGGPRELGDSARPRLEGLAGDGYRGDQSGRDDEGAARHPAEAGAWSDFDIIPFVTGEFRRVESGTFPLAHGIPGRMGRLRGYGNAVVPQLAAEFIAAYMGVRP